MAAKTNIGPAWAGPTGPVPAPLKYHNKVHVRPSRAMFWPNWVFMKQAPDQVQSKYLRLYRSFGINISIYGINVSIKKGYKCKYLHYTWSGVCLKKTQLGQNVARYGRTLLWYLHSFHTIYGQNFDGSKMRSNSN